MQKKTEIKKTKKKKLKMLPTLREKKHYLVLTIKDKTDKNLKAEINKAIIDFIGILGYAKAGILFIEQNKIRGKHYLILSVATKYVDSVKAALTLTSYTRCIGVSGTLKKAGRFFK